MAPKYNPQQQPPPGNYQPGPGNWRPAPLTPSHFQDGDRALKERNAWLIADLQRMDEKDLQARLALNNQSNTSGQGLQATAESQELNHLRVENQRLKEMNAQLHAENQRLKYELIIKMRAHNQCLRDEQAALEAALEAALPVPGEPAS